MHIHVLLWVFSLIVTKFHQQILFQYNNHILLTVQNQALFQKQFYHAFLNFKHSLSVNISESPKWLGLLMNKTCLSMMILQQHSGNILLNEVFGSCNL